MRKKYRSKYIEFQIYVLKFEFYFTIHVLQFALNWEKKLKLTQLTLF